MLKVFDNPSCEATSMNDTTSLLFGLDGYGVLDVTDVANLDPLNLDHWRFLVVPTRVLNTEVPGQKSIVLHRLAALPGVAECTYTDLRDTVETAGTP